jgi:hypothetical protein
LNSPRSIIRLTLALSLVVFAGIVAFAGPPFLAGRPVMAEDGPVETIGCLLLFGGFLLTLQASIARTPARPVFGLLAVLYLSLALRELDLRPTDAPQWLIRFTYHDRPFWLTPIWVALVFWAWLKRNEWKPLLKSYDWKYARDIACVLVVLFVIAYGFERHWWTSDRKIGLFFEETFEVLLEWHLLGAALLARAAARDLRIGKTARTS